MSMVRKIAQICYKPNEYGAGTGVIMAIVSIGGKPPLFDVVHAYRKDGRPTVEIIEEGVSRDYANEATSIPGYVLDGGRNIEVLGHLCTAFGYNFEEIKRLALGP